MNCRGFQNQMLEATENKEIQLPEIVFDHISNCPECSQFHQSLIEIKKNVLRLKPESVPSKLESETLNLCLKKLDTANTSKKPMVSATPSKIPLSILIVTIILICLGAFWIASTLNLLLSESIVISQANLAILFIIQNIIMLLFAPLLLKIYKSKEIYYSSSNLILITTA